MVINTLMQNIVPKYAKATGENFSTHGITEPQAQILLLLEQANALKVSEIAGTLHMVESNVSNICSRLENAGYVTRTRQKDDRRVVKIALTDTALPKIADIKRRILTFYDQMQSFVTSKDIDAICDGLRKLDTLLTMFLENNDRS